MLITSLLLFALYILFQLMYIFIPLFCCTGERPACCAQEKPMTILVPAYNEAHIILNCVHGLQQLCYQDFQAIIIDDGSTDATFSLLARQLQLRPTQHPTTERYYQSQLDSRLFVVRQVNGGKSAALNTGLRLAAHELIVTLDADSVLHPQALAIANATFEDVTIIAAGGLVQIAQGYEGSYARPQPRFSVSSLIRAQIVTYVTDFYLHKTTQEKWQAITVIAGAFGVFRKEALLTVGGYRQTVGEDLDMTLRLQQLLKARANGQRIAYMPHAICYTECPASLRALFQQRIRWQKGFIDCLLHFRTSFFTTLPTSVSIYVLLDSFLLGTVATFPTLMMPIVIAYHQQFSVALAFLLITYVLALYRSMTAFIIQRRYQLAYCRKDRAVLALFLPLEIYTYRLLGLLFVTLGTIFYIKDKNSWPKIERSGQNALHFQAAEPDEGKGSGHEKTTHF